jgi:hypothetical protein
LNREKKIFDLNTVAGNNAAILLVSAPGFKQLSTTTTKNKNIV